MRRRDFSDDQELDRLLQRWDAEQHTEMETRRMLRTVEMRWSEERSRQDRFRHQDVLFSISLLLFVVLASSAMWLRPVWNVRDWPLMVAAIAAVIVVVLLPALLKSDQGRGHGE